MLLLIVVGEEKRSQNIPYLAVMDKNDKTALLQLAASSDPAITCLAWEIQYVLKVLSGVFKLIDRGVSPELIQTYFGDVF